MFVNHGNMYKIYANTLYNISSQNIAYAIDNPYSICYNIICSQERASATDGLAIEPGIQATPSRAMVGQSEL